MNRDTEVQAIELLKRVSSRPIQNAEAIPDPQVDGVWLVFFEDGGQPFAALVYLNEDDFELVEYEEAQSKYGHRRVRG